MYEPLFLPDINETIAPHSVVRYGVVHAHRFIGADDPDVEPLHMHGYIEIFFSISSDVSFLVNNNLYPVNDGDAIISRENDIHMCLFNRTRLHEYVCLWVDCDKNSPLVDFFHSDDASPHLSFDKDTSAQLREMLTSLAELKGTAENELERASLLLQILVLFKTGSAMAHAAAKVPEQFQKILDHINENFAQIRYVNDILDDFFVSSATLNRWFRRYIRLSAREYLESKKLAHAAMLLANGESVTEACIRSGFCDCSHFIRLFKKSFGETPLKYKQHREKN